MRRLAARGLLRRQALKPGAIITPRDTWSRFDGALRTLSQHQRTHVGLTLLGAVGLTLLGAQPPTACAASRLLALPRLPLRPQSEHLV